MIEFAMPSLGADMDAGMLVEWYKRPGDPLQWGDIIALVETQKGSIEIEVFQDGLLGEIRVNPGQNVPVGTVLATILAPGETAAPAGPAAAAPPLPEPPTPPAAVPVASTAMPPLPLAGARRKVTPAARRRASGMDLAVIPAGPDGIIGLREVEAALLAKPVARRPGLDLGEMRKAIAAAMSRSNRDIPHYWVTTTIDVTPLLAWLEAENGRRPIVRRLLYAAPLTKAVARALKESPELNGHYVDGVFRPAGSVHLGIATALRGGGLVAPALHDVDRLDVDALMAALGDLVPRARAGRLRSSELTDATATFSNLGEGMAEMLLPLVYPPQVAIVGCGGVATRPWVADGAIAPRRVLQVTVAGDHRVSDGRRASRFLGHLTELLQKPEAL